MEYLAGHLSLYYTMRYSAGSKERAFEHLIRQLQYIGGKTHTDKKRGLIIEFLAVAAGEGPIATQ